MMIEISDLGKYDFSFSEIKLTDNNIRKTRTIEKTQKRNTLIYILQGHLRIPLNGEKINFPADSIIYFPTGSQRKMIVEALPTHYHRIDFALKIDDEFATFSNSPMQFSNFSASMTRMAVQELNEACQKSEDKLLRCEKLCKLLSTLIESAKKPPSPKLRAAVEYLNANFTKSIDCRALAEMCFLSTAQFYNLFHKSYGTTPLEYRNALVLQKAELLLSTQEFTVSEVAQQLEFSDAAYFSRFFKKAKGICPMAYQKQKRSF